jgi:hypothetical protein
MAFYGFYGKFSLRFPTSRDCFKLEFARTTLLAVYPHSIPSSLRACYFQQLPACYFQQFTIFPASEFLDRVIHFQLGLLAYLVVFSLRLCAPASVRGVAHGHWTGN